MAVSVFPIFLLAALVGVATPALAGDLPQPGRYGCTDPDGEAEIGLDFRLGSGGTYQDRDGGRRGTYAYDPAAATLRFTGGFLDGQIARSVGPAGFLLSPTVRCGPR